MNRKSTFLRIWGYIKRYRLLLLLSIFFAAVTVILSLYIPILAGQAIDFALGKGRVNIDGIISLMIKIGIITAIVALLQWLMNIINNKLAFSILRDIRKDSFLKVQTLPLRYLDSHQHGDTLSRIITDAEQLSEGLLLGLTQFFVSALTIVVTLIFMLIINVSVALCVFLITPLSLLAARFITKRTYSMFYSQSRLRGEQTAFFNEVVTNQKTIIAYGAMEKCTEKFKNINDELGKHTQRAIFFSSLTNPATRFVNSIVYVVVAAVGAFAVISNPFVMSAGLLVSLLSYAGQYTKPFNEISGVIAELQNSLACAGRIFELLDETAEVSDKDSKILKKPVLGNVELNCIDFSYITGKPVIKNISLSVKKGQRIAIVGHTGSGKTTFVNLLMRFYDIDKGTITVDGMEINQLKRHSLRDSFGMVLQDTFLINGTIKENIRLGKTDANDEEITQAAKLSFAHNFIKKMPHGYNTVVNDGKVALSEGQKQLISIARVFLKKPPMLILDEATSAVDALTEKNIKEAFDRLMVGRTSFVVAHRLSTIISSDLILFMKDGEIVERGTHKELLEQAGLYSDLYFSKLKT